MRAVLRTCIPIQPTLAKPFHRDGWVYEERRRVADAGVQGRRSGAEQQADAPDLRGPVRIRSFETRQDSDLTDVLITVGETEMDQAFAD
jgi:hypothetical protein